MLELMYDLPSKKNVKTFTVTRAMVDKHTGAKVLPMCHQTQARPGTDTYFDMVRHNMETIIRGLKETNQDESVMH